MTYASRLMVVSVCTLTILLSVTIIPPSLFVNDRVSAGAMKTKIAADRSIDEVQSRASSGRIHQLPDTPHTLAAAYYSTQGYSALLMVTNQGPDPMEVRPLLFGSTGERLEIPAVTLEGNQLHAFNLNELAALGGPSFREGSVQVNYDGHFVELGGVVQMIDDARSLIFDEELTEPTKMFASSKLEGTWWLPSRQTDFRLAISNTTDAQISATIAVDGEMPKATRTENVSLAPHESRVIDMRSFISGTGQLLPKIGGVSIRHNGKPGALLSHGLIEERGTGFSSVVEFNDPGRPKTTQLHGAGLRLGGIGGEDLFQVGVARNVGSADTILTGRIPITTIDDQVTTFELPPTQLAAGETKELNLIVPMNKKLRTTLVSAGLEFEYTGEPGTVAVSALSMSKSGNQVFRVPVLDARAQVSSTGRYPWSINGSSSTVAYIKNVTDEKQQYFLQIDFAGGVYVAGIQTVEPGQTAVFDVRAIRDQKIPDEQGRTIPSTATGGKITWSVIGPKNFVLLGRAEQVDAVRGLSSTNACSSCCPIGYANSFCDPPAVTGLPQDTTRFRAFQSNADCHGNFYAPFLVSPEFWTSSDPAVASVDGTGLATALSFGSTGIQASWTTYNLAHGGPEVCDVDPEECDDCIETAVTAVADAFCDVAGIRGRVVSPPISNDGDAVIALQEFTLEAEIVTQAGGRARSFSGNTALAIEGIGQIQGELLPNGITLSEGIGTVRVNLRAVTATGRPGRNYNLTFTDGAGTTHFSGIINVWFDVLATREGLVGGTTACNHTIVANDHFVALPATGLCNTGVLVLNGNNSESTSVLDVGPWFPHAAPTSGNPCVGGNDPYWTTTGVPRAQSSPCSNGAGIDLADGTFAALGLTGNARIQWRFRQ